MKDIIKFVLVSCIIYACTTEDKEIKGCWKLVSGISESSATNDEKLVFDSTFLFLLNFKNNGELEMYNEETNDFVQIGWSIKNDSILLLNNSVPSPFYYYVEGGIKQDNIIRFKNGLLEVKTTCKEEQVVYKQELILKRVEDQLSYLPSLRDKISAEKTSVLYSHLSFSLRMTLESLASKNQNKRTSQILKIAEDIFKEIDKIKSDINQRSGWLRERNGAMVRPFIQLRKEKFNVDLSSAVESYEKLIAMSYRKSKYKTKLEGEYLIDNFAYISTIPKKMHRQYNIEVSETISAVEAMNNLSLFEIYTLNLGINLISE